MIASDNKQSQLQVVPPLDWGVSFALRFFLPCLGLALVPAILEIAVGYLQYTHAVSQQQQFLLLVMLLASKAWLLSAIFMFAIERLRDEKPSTLRISWRALRYLPKILIAYVVLFSLFASSFLILPLLILILFFVWAPAFCVGELYAPQDRPDAEEDEAEEFAADFGENDIFSQARAPQREVTFFSRKAIWELGFARSMHFVAGNVGVTFQIMLLVWFANVIPIAMVYGVLGVNSPGFSVKFLTILISSASDALALCLAAGAFLMLLPAKARAELGAREYLSPAEFVPGKAARVVRLQGRVGVFIVLGVLSFFSTFLLFEQLQRSQEMPASVVVELERTRVSDDVLTLRLRLSDVDYQLRWFNPEGLKISLVNPADAKKKSDGFPQTEDAVSANTPEVKEKLLEPVRIVAYRDSSEEVLLTDLIPSAEPVVLELQFKVPPELPEAGRFILYYSSLSGHSRRIFEERYRR